jgi:hypothetical protein
MICKVCGIDKSIEFFERYGKESEARRKTCKKCRQFRSKIKNPKKEPRKNCSTCNDPLTEINKALDSKSPHGCRPQCKPCRQKKQHSHRLKNDTVQRNCIHCKVLFFRKTTATNRCCSDKCRVMSKVEIQNETECWKWTGNIRKGIPIVADKNKQFTATRYIYELFMGKAEKDMFIYRTCELKPCVNPNHCKQGTHKEFIRSKVGLFLKKTKNVDIKKVRELFEKYRWSKTDIAKKYNICLETVCNIINRKKSYNFEIDDTNNYHIIDSDEAMQKLLDEINKSLDE